MCIRDSPGIGEGRDVVLDGGVESEAVEVLRSEVVRDAANLAEPLIPAATLRAHVLAGEAKAAGREVQDDGGDLIALIARIRG